MADFRLMNQGGDEDIMVDHRTRDVMVARLRRELGADWPKNVEVNGGHYHVTTSLTLVYWIEDPQGYVVQDIKL